MISHTDNEGDPLAAVVAAAPPGLAVLTSGQRRALSHATGSLLERDGAAASAELTRFTHTATRGIAVNDRELRKVHAGRVVLVTGGTGCIGSELIRQLSALEPRRIVSVSRGVETRWARSPKVEYVHLDIRDATSLRRLVRDVQPDIVYHLAAQHDPGLAEIEVSRTLTTNVMGTINVIAACRQVGGLRLACASTGKALRPFTRDIYCASKKMNEWLFARASNEDDLKVSAVRFTHVVDNSIILDRLLSWVALGEPVRLHDLNAMFYMQSAREAAQLLTSSVLDATPAGLALTAIRDLGWPVALLDLALGVLQGGPRSSPLYVCGVEAGYEKAPYPGLYDPAVSGDVSPLFNAIEAGSAQQACSSADVDVYIPQAMVDLQLEQAITDIGTQAAAQLSDAELRNAVVECGWGMLTDFLKGMNSSVLSRHVSILESRPPTAFSSDDRIVRSKVLLEHKHRIRATTPLPRTLENLSGSSA